MSKETRFVWIDDDKRHAFKAELPDGWLDEQVVAYDRNTNAQADEFIYKWVSYKYHSQDSATETKLKIREALESIDALNSERLQVRQREAEVVQTEKRLSTAMLSNGSVLPTAKPTPSIRKPPGGRILAVTDFLFTTKFNERVIRQVIADQREEYFQALSQGQKWRAKWMHFLCTPLVLVALLASIPGSLLSKLSSIAK